MEYAELPMDVYKAKLEQQYKTRVHSIGHIQDVELERFKNENPSILEQQIILG